MPVVNNENKHLFFLRVNCYDAVVPQCPFGGFKCSGFGRELYVDDDYFDFQFANCIAIFFLAEKIL